MRLSIFTGVILLVAVAIFLPVWTGGTLMTTDDNIGAVAGYKAQLSAGFGQQAWSESPLVGMPAGVASLNWSNFWIRYLPLRAFANTFHALSLVAGSLALGFYLFRKNLSLGAVLVAALAAFWVGTNFTLIHAGHIRKFSIVFLFCATLVCLDKLFETRRWNWGVIAGALVGMMFLEQQDVALFFGLFAGAYALFLVTSAARPEPRPPTKGEKREGEAPAEPQKSGALANFARLVPVVAVALMICIGPVLSAYRQNVAGIASMEQSRAEKWEFCTQWSQPPEESIDFIAPGYTGWRSGEPTGPYWGRMGRSAGWEQSRQGFMNFRLENTYLGIIPVLLALFALFAARSSAHRAVIFFWGGAALVALLLAFGKYTPLYALFWQLPVINNIRNPNKFIQIFQIAVAILAAFGLDAVLRDKAAAKKFFWGAVGVFVVCLLWAFGSTTGQSGVAADFARQGWPSDMARVIATNQSSALWHAAFFAAVAVILFAIPKFVALQRHQTKLIAGLIILLAADAVWLSRHYVQKMPRGFIEENAVTRFLKKEPGAHRIATITQDGFYNLWLTYLFPYHDIPHFNFTQMPRMPQDYQQFLTALQRNPLRMWQLSGVGFLLGPAQVASQLPPGSYEAAMRFDVIPGADGSLSVQENPQGPHAIFRALKPAPRFALVGGVEQLGDSETLAKLSSPEWSPFDTILIHPDELMTATPASDSVGTVEVVDEKANAITLKLNAREGGFLRFAGKHDTGWKAFTGGKPVNVLRADYLMQAIPVNAGEQIVEWRYEPAGAVSWIWLGGFGCTALAAILLILPAKRKYA